MATKPRRVHVTLPAPVWELVGRIAELTGQPRASVIGELVSELQPVMESTIEALEYVKKGRPLEAQRVLANMGAAAVSDLCQQQLSLDDAIAEALDGRTIEGRKARRRARAGAA